MDEHADSDVMEPPGYVGASNHGPVNVPVGTDLCVAGDSRTEDGYRWVAVRQNGGPGNGWVAARFCALREAQGCAR
jgi:hypothetical protein